MDKNTDQTNFWLAWHATCAAVDCTDQATLEKACAADPQRYESVLADLEGTQKLAMDMIASTNSKFKRAMAYWREKMTRMNSDYADEMLGWEDGSPRRGCAFTLLEGQLYANKTICGRPFKDYLFEDVATREGTCCGNLCGYVNNTLFDIVKKSFSKTFRMEEKLDDKGKVVDDDRLSTKNSDNFESLSSGDRAEIDEVAEFFGHYVDERCSAKGDIPPEWEDDNLIALYCAFHQIPISNEEVVRLCAHKKSSLSLISHQTLDDLLLTFRRRDFARMAIARALQVLVPSILCEKIKDRPFFSQLEKICENRAMKKPKA